MRTAVLFLALALVLPARVSGAPQRTDVDFERDVLPIFARHCVECHGAEKSKGKLRFDRARSVRRVVEPGLPDESELLFRVRLPSDDLDAMPPDGPALSRADVTTLERWVADGADWPTELGGPLAVEVDEVETLAPHERTPERDEPVAFTDVRRVLAANCFACHGPDEATRAARLRLDERESATKPRGRRAPAIVAGDSTASLLVERVTESDDDARMPPAEFGPRLGDADVALLRRWIDEGAEWEAHWSFVAPRRPDVPPLADGNTSAIDAFVRERLAREDIEPSDEADRYTLARRVSLDLTGLPPTVAEVDAFVADAEPDAYARFVDAKLADPAFGERWATVWLDQARYADTKGYEKDARRTMWPYRDWVVRALNADMPFDAFTRAQLAGDLAPDASDASILATAFHRNTMTNDEGGTDDEEFRNAAVVDRVNTTMQVWNGLSFGCAQCHTHKYDPITNREYYEVFAVFNQTEDADRDDEAPLLAMPTVEQREEVDRLERAAIAARAAFESEQANATERAHAWIDARKNERAPAGALVLDSATFDGTAAVDLGDAGDFERDRAFTVAFWMRRDGGGVHVPIAKMDGADHRGWDVYVEDGRLSAHLIHAWPDNAARVTTKERLPDGEWTHVAVAWDGSSKASAARIYVDGRAADATATHDSLTATIRTERPLLLGRRFGDPSMQGAVDQVRLYARALEGEEVRALAAADAAHAPERLERVALAVDDVLAAARQALGDAERAVDEARARIPRVPVMRALAEDARRTTRIQRRGSFLDLGDEVSPNTPAAFGPKDEDGRPIDRAAFADWLVDPLHPLTARVQVNRVWEQLFGTGLVETAEDFGTQGAPPSHPALLDWLALEYIERGWSLKELCRLVVTSSTYRQASTMRAHAHELDPTNRLLWRGPRHRLGAEMLRDQALAVSGLLAKTMFGPPVFPPQPDGVWSMVYSGDEWRADEGEDRYRRALYTFWRRTSPYPSMTTFDAPSREFCVARRIRTNTPLQALVTLNDPVFVEAARALARRVAREHPEAGPSARAGAALRMATGRPAKARETEALVELFDSEFWHYDGARDAAAALVPDATEGEDVAELAAWTVVCNVLLNLDEVLVKE